MASQAEFTLMPSERANAVPPVRAGGALACLPWRELAGEIEAWDELARRAAEPNPFFESWYLLPSLERLDGEGAVSVLCFREGGALRGLVPVVRPPRYYGWPIPNLATWTHANCFFGAPLVARGAEAPFWAALLDWADDNPGAAAFLHLTLVDLDGPGFAALEAVLARDGRPWAVVMREPRPMLAAGLGAEAYLDAALGRRKRKDLERRFRRLAELGSLRVEWETGGRGLSAWIEAFLALEAAGWKGKAGSALACDPATAALFRESLAGAAERDRLLRLSLRLDGEPIAMLSTFATPPGAFGYKTAFDEAYARFAPGILLEREFLAVLDRPGIDWCDSCAAADHSVMNRFWRERRRIGRVSIAIGGPLRRAAFRGLVRRELAGRTEGIAR